MKRVLLLINSGLRKLIDKGFFHILIGNTLVKCISLCSAIFLPRIIVPESAYGMLTTVDNVNSYLILLNGLGLSNSVLRYCSMQRTQGKKSAIFRFCLKYGVLADGLILVIFIPLLLFSGLFTNGNYGAAKEYILFASLIPVTTYLVDVYLLYMRANLLNKTFSKVSVIYSLLYAGLQVIMAFICFINGVYIGRYLALTTVAVICYVTLCKKNVLIKPEPEEILSWSDKREMFRYGIGCMITNTFSLIMPLNETWVVNTVLVDLDTTAFYKAASMIPSNLQYIATSVVVFIYPYFAQNGENMKWVKKNIWRLLAGMCGLMIPIIALCYWLSPYIIIYIYGENYAPAITIMRPMWIAFGVNAILRIPLGNVLAAMGKLRFNIALSAVISLMHFGLDFYFIKNLGIGGAAYALMITYTFSSICSIVYIIRMTRRGTVDAE